MVHDAAFRASMRPRRNRLGRDAENRLIDTNLRSFNEAEAQSPRKGSLADYRPDVAERCFNEAEAQSPRKGPCS